MVNGKAMAAQGNGARRADLSRERWQRVKAVLSAVLEAAPEDRQQCLEKECAGDFSIRAEVEGLLSLEPAAENAFPALPLLPPDQDEAPSPGRIGRRIGPYRIVEQIGVGGMGEVYRAFRDDDQYKKEVAIKLVRAGRDSNFVLSRFRNERQVLANLDHPNIGRLLDGGTTEDGMPYFVMELIVGQPIHQYCTARKLSITGRLRLFLQVCSAVQYAHQRLIVHRDLKPGNILVTPEGVPKLLDFGIAKILDPAEAEVSDTTVSAFRPLTPGYASPEQIKGEPITTASDVYSLGVLLYELLTGHSPYHVASQAPHEIARAICEHQPARPSSTIMRRDTSADGSHASCIDYSADNSPERLRKQLRGDLDSIVLMALRKEPQRRYSSVDQFAADIRRHLEKLPVSASRDTFRYRTAKFLARHRKSVAAAAALAFALLAGVAATLYEAHRARQNELRAEKRFADVRALASSLLFEVHDAIKDLAGATPARKLLVSEALKYLQTLSQDAAGDISLQSQLADAYQRVGDVQGNPDYPNLGDTAGALESYRRALELRKSAIQAGAKGPAIQRSLSADYARVGMMLESQGNSRDALQNYREAFAIAQDLNRRGPDLQSEQQLGSIYFILGRYYGGLKDSKAELENFQKSAEIRESIAKSSPLAKTRLAGTYSAMAQILWSAGEREKAIAFHDRATEIMRELSESDPANAFYREYLDEAYYGTGVFLERSGDLARAVVNYRRACADLARLTAADPAEVHTRRDLASCTSGLGAALIAQGRTAEGLMNLRRAATIAEKLPAPEDSDALADADYALGYGLLRATHHGGLSQAQKAAFQAEGCAALKQSAGILADAAKSEGKSSAALPAAFNSMLTTCRNIPPAPAP
jgi:serine/threonine protein kinase